MAVSPSRSCPDACGDEPVDRAFQELFCRHQRALTAYCRRLIEDQSDADDVLQNTAVRVMLALRRGVKPRQERAWLYRIAYNEAMNLFRARRQMAPLDDQLPAGTDDPAHATLLKERISETVDDLGALTPRARQILVMREFSGLGREEIAVTLGISPKAVSQSLSDARARLRLQHGARETGASNRSLARRSAQ